MCEDIQFSLHVWFRKILYVASNCPYYVCYKVPMLSNINQYVKQGGSQITQNFHKNLRKLPKIWPFIVVFCLPHFRLPPTDFGTMLAFPLVSAKRINTRLHRRQRQSWWRLFKIINCSFYNNQVENCNDTAQIELRSSWCTIANSWFQAMANTQQTTKHSE